MGELRVADVRTMVPLCPAHDFENFTEFAPSQNAVKKADEMLAELACWVRRCARCATRSPRPHENGHGGSMRAVMLYEFDPPSTLTPVEVPEPGQVVVRVALANITFVETQVRVGKPAEPGDGARAAGRLG